jgi:hypothetical protein
MAIRALTEGAAGGGVEYSGHVTPFVVLSCVVAGSGGVLFGYDLGISGASGYSHLQLQRIFLFLFFLCQLRISSCFFVSLLVNMSCMD